MAKKLKYGEGDFLALTRTLWGEARGESDEGKVAVAWVIRNRLAKPGWWSRERGDGVPDDTIEAVCKDPAQFSCWWDKQAPRVRTLSPSDSRGCDRIARAVLEGEIEDPTGGATHYHTILRPQNVGKWPPSWANSMVKTKVVGSHIFYASR